jgi:TolA-binding protein
VVGGGGALAYRATQKPNAANTALRLPPAVRPSDPSTPPASMNLPPGASPLAVPPLTTPKPQGGTSEPAAAGSAPREKVRPNVAPIGAAAATTRVEGINPSSPDALPPLNPTTLEDETRLVRAGMAALLGGDPARALALFDDHAQRYPNGALAEERAAERITALCDLDRVDEANRAAAAFVREHSSSPLVARVSAGCARAR